MNRGLNVTLFDLAKSLSSATDLINEDMVNHHKRVTYISLRLAEEMSLSSAEIEKIVIAGILHDIGSLSFEDKQNIKNYELVTPHLHAEVGYGLLQKFGHMNEIAEIVRFHHVFWSHGAGEYFADQKIPLGSFIIHLADRVEVLIERNKKILTQVPRIVERINRDKDTKFHPDVVEAFNKISHREYFWLDLKSGYGTSLITENLTSSKLKMNMDDLLQFTKIFSQIVDFRSAFTATHSSGVAHTSEALARKIGMPDKECLTMRIAGYLHDLGKLAIPTEILEKPAKLDEEEYNVMRSHTYYTYRILMNVPSFQQIAEWGAFHHEKLNGKGYPFRLGADDLNLGARIMAVADVFTAITEDRPYRTGMEKKRVMSILQRLVEDGSLDPFVVSVIGDHYEEINEIRITAQEEARSEYQRFKSSVKTII